MLLSDLGYDARELSLLLTDDSEIQQLNLQYRAKDKATDVLSFALDESQSPESKLLGDIVISVDTAERQANEQGVSLAEEIARLLIHGLLHLMGYDHENVSPEKAKQMQSEEERLYKALYR